MYPILMTNTGPPLASKLLCYKVQRALEISLSQSMSRPRETRLSGMLKTLEVEHINSSSTANAVTRLLVPASIVSIVSAPCLDKTYDIY